MGEIRMPMSRLLPGNSARARPKAASVPSTVARVAAMEPTIRLLTSEFCHGADRASSAYQRSE